MAFEGEISLDDLALIMAGQPATGMPDQSSHLGSTEALPDPAKLQMEIEALSAKLNLMRESFAMLLVHLQLTDRNL
jgi:hypothetical protein